MTDNTSYEELMADYMASLRDLSPALAEPRRTTIHAAVMPPPSDEEMADKAEALAARSAAVGARTAEYLHSEDQSQRELAEMKLLAQAAAELAVAGSLIAQAEAAQAPRVRTRAGVPQEMPSPPAIADLMGVLEAPIDAGTGAVVRRRRVRVAAPVDPDAAKDELRREVDSTLQDILSEAAETSQQAIEGLLLMDAAVLKEAASVVSAELADKLSEQASRLLASAISLALKAYDKILALLGAEMTSEIRQKVTEWIEELKSGALLPTLLGQLYSTEAISGDIATWLEESEADVPTINATRDAVDRLGVNFEAKADLAGKAISALSVIKSLPVVATPQAQLLLAGGYLAVTGYVIYAGYDHVDSDQIKLLDRVQGVHGTVQESLGVAAV